MKITLRYHELSDPEIAQKRAEKLGKIMNVLAQHIFERIIFLECLPFEGEHAATFSAEISLDLDERLQKKFLFFWSEMLTVLSTFQYLGESAELVHISQNQQTQRELISGRKMLE